MYFTKLGHFQPGSYVKEENVILTLLSPSISWGPGRNGPSSSLNHTTIFHLKLGKVNGMKFFSLYTIESK